MIPMELHTRDGLGAADKRAAYEAAKQHKAVIQSAEDFLRGLRVHYTSLKQIIFL